MEIEYEKRAMIATEDKKEHTIQNKRLKNKKSDAR